MALCWFDLEATGLSASNDAILEVAWTLTDTALEPLGKSAIHTLLVDCGPVEFDLLARAREVVVEMHAKSGLTQALSDPLLDHYSLEEIASEVMNDIDKWVEPGEPVYLAGASVHFDLGFIREQMPELASRLSHRVYDTSTLKAFFEEIGVQHGVENEGQHRAANDVLEVLEVARVFRVWAHTVKNVSMAATGGLVG